jgi:hypothetical protein
MRWLLIVRRGGMTNAGKSGRPPDTLATHFVNNSNMSTLTEAMNAGLLHTEQEFLTET